METAARLTIIAGIALIVIGAVLFALARFNIPLGRLPGDIHIVGKNGSFYFPLTSSILISIILTVVLNLITKFLRK